MASWDDEEFEPTLVKNITTVVTNKWEGEDEEENLKVSWEDEDEEQEQPKKQQQPQAVKSKKKKLFKKTAEKKRQREEGKQEQEEDISTLEQIREDEESVLNVALGTTFCGEQNNNTVLQLPSTKADFSEFTDSVTKKLLSLSANPNFPSFTEGLVRSLCASMKPEDIRKTKNTLDSLYHEKQKIEKSEKTKKNKSKGKAKLKVEHNNLHDFANDYYYDDFI